MSYVAEMIVATTVCMNPVRSMVLFRLKVWCLWYGGRVVPLASGRYPTTWCWAVPGGESATSGGSWH